MSLKCSVLGHRFDETAVERERHEEGTEVIVTITEVETCSRCGESRIVSENKEVTALDTPDDDTTGDATDAGADTHTGSTGSQGEDRTADVIDSEDDDAEIIDAGSDTEPAPQATEQPGEAIPDAEGGTTGSGADDDAEIIDGDGSSGERPAARDRGAADNATPDEAEAGDGNGDGNGDGDGDGDGDGTERGSGSWPEEPESGVEQPAGAADWPDDGDESAVEPGTGPIEEWPEETKRDPGADSTADGPDLEPTEGATVTVPEGMFKCSECGFTTEVESSSLRAGDFCPECQRGTLVQDTDAE